MTGFRIRTSLARTSYAPVVQIPTAASCHEVVRPFVAATVSSRACQEAAFRHHGWPGPWSGPGRSTTAVGGPGTHTAGHLRPLDQSRKGTIERQQYACDVTYTGDAAS